MGVKIPVDFTGVEQKGSVRVKEGDYLAKIKKVEKTNAKSSGNPMLVMRFELVSGPKDAQGKVLIDRHILTKDSLWTLRNMLEAMGYSVPARQMKLDTDKMLVGRKVGISVRDGDEYRGKISSDVVDYLPPSAVDNKVDTDDSNDFESDDDDEDDALGVFAGDDDDEEDEDDFDLEEEDESDDDDEDDDSEWEEGDADDEEEDDEDEGDENEDEITLSFDSDDVDEAKGPDLKKYLKEAKEAGFEFDLGQKAKVEDVRSALAEIFIEDDEDEDEEDDDEMEDFDLEDIE